MGEWLLALGTTCGHRRVETLDFEVALFYFSVNIALQAVPVCNTSAPLEDHV